MKTPEQVYQPTKWRLGVITLAAVLAVLTFATPTEAAVVDGLVEYWQFEGDYSATEDASNDGILVTSGTGSASFVAGKFGQAVDLANSTDNQAVINVGDVAEFAFTGGSMTVSAWYTTESLYTGWQAVVSQSEGGNWRLARNGTSGTNFKWAQSGPQQIYAYLDRQDGSWHHVAVTHDAAGDATMYIDGAPGGSVAAWVLGNGNGLRMQIGGNSQAGGRGWDGNIDDVALWDRALSAEDIAAIWNGGDGASIASLVGGAPSGFPLTITRNGSFADLTWESQTGKLYDVLSSTDVTLDLALWTLVEEEIPATPPSNTETVSLSSETTEYFVVSEKDAPPPPSPLNEDFEAGNGGFTVVTTSGTGWEHGDPDAVGEFGGSVTTGNGGSGNCWGTGIGDFTATADRGYYAEGTTTSLISPVIDLTLVASATLTFAENLDVEGNDTAVVNIIAEFTDTVIAAAIYTAIDPDINTTGWNNVGPIAIPAAALGQKVRLEFSFSGAGFPAQDFVGWFIDDVLVVSP
jgi:hypothetical protein